MDRNFDQIRLLTVTEAASLLQVSTRTLQRMIRNHDLPALKVGGQRRMRESQLTKLDRTPRRPSDSGESQPDRLSMAIMASPALANSANSIDSGFGSSE